MFMVPIILAYTAYSLLGVPRQGQGRRGVSLMHEVKQPLAKRLAWFVLLWLGGVTAVGVLAYAIKWGMGLA